MEGAKQWLSTSTRGTLLPISNIRPRRRVRVGPSMERPHRERAVEPHRIIVRTLYRRKTTLCCLAGLGMLAAALFSAVQPRLYRSQASIQIQGVNENFLNLRDVFPTAAPSADNAVYVQTQAEMLQQDSLLELVVDKLHLQERPEYQRSARPLGRRPPV